MKDGEIIGQFRVLRIRATYDYKTGETGVSEDIECLKCGSTRVHASCECGSCRSGWGHSGGGGIRGDRYSIYCCNCKNQFYHAVDTTTR